MSSYASGISLIANNQIYYSAGVYYTDFIKETYDTPWYQDYQQSEQSTFISPPHEMWVDNSYKQCVSWSIKFYDFSGSKPAVNYLIFEIPLYRLENALASDLMVIDSQNRCLVKSQSDVSPEQILNAKGKEMISVSDHVVFPKHMKETDWTLYLPVLKKQFHQQITTMIFILILLFSAGLITALIILSKIIKKATAPISVIKTAMENAIQGNLEVESQVHSADELEFLSDCFNKLIIDLKAYIQKIIDYEEAHRQIQSDLLLSQIHPHFIYNTLNSAIYLIEEEENSQAINILYSLITILQNVVKIGNRQIFTTVQEELELLKAYIQIESIRYPERFQVSIQCDPKLWDVPVPQVMIQPLVENSLFHGILPSERFGKISISITERGQTLHISIQDNGIGISEQDMEDLMQKSASSVHGIGLSNIKNRVHFLYPEGSADLSISSVPNEGTTVSISLPITASPPEHLQAGNPHSIIKKGIS
ncbi:MAG: sensor histidine kinase [Massiliimalia sp.]|jgi:two-component system sensor histidine kinase YesM